MSDRAGRAVAPPLVSVVIPVFNAERFLDQCLSSVAAQRYARLQIVCVNDGSVDGSSALLARHAADDSRISVVEQHNQGVSAARNAGLDLATGDLVMFVDADDYLEPDAVATWVAAMTDDVDLVIEGDPNPCYSTGSVEITRLLLRGLRTAMLNPPWGKLYRRDVIESESLRFETRVSLGEDVLFNLGYLRHAEAVRTLPGRCYTSRPVPGSLTRSYRPTKDRDLTIVHERIRSVTAPFQTAELDALLIYLRIKALISCTSSDLGSGSPWDAREARQRCERRVRENPGLRVEVGDAQMRFVGAAYRWLGLWRTTQLVMAAKAVTVATRSLSRRSFVFRRSLSGTGGPGHEPAHQ